MTSPAGYVNATVRRHAAQTSLIATVMTVSGGRVRLLRNGQRAPDTTTYPVRDDLAATLGPGDVVSVLKTGGSYLVIGKLTITTTPPPPVVVPPTSSGLYAGVWQPDPVSDPTLSGLEAFETTCNKHQALVGYYRDFAAGADVDAGSVLAHIDAHGSTPYLTLEPWDRSGASDPTRYTLAAILAGSFDAVLTAAGTALGAFGKPVFLRFAQEMNGTRYPWAGDPLYVPAWRYAYGKIAPLAPKVLWVWAPAAWQPAALAPGDPQAFYPGDGFAQWIGLSGYNSARRSGSWQSFTQLFGYAYGQLQSAHTLPFMLAEWGCDADPRKAAWLASALGTEIPRFFPLLKAEAYTNEDQTAALGLGAQWPITSDGASALAFRTAMASAYYLPETA